MKAQLRTMVAIFTLVLYVVMCSIPGGVCACLKDASVNTHTIASYCMPHDINSTVAKETRITQWAKSLLLLLGISTAVSIPALGQSTALGVSDIVPTIVSTNRDNNADEKKLIQEIRRLERQKKNLKKRINWYDEALKSSQTDINPFSGLAIDASPYHLTLGSGDMVIPKLGVFRINTDVQFGNPNMVLDRNLGILDLSFNRWLTLIKGNPLSLTASYNHVFTEKGSLFHDLNAWKLSFNYDMKESGYISLGGSYARNAMQETQQPLLSYSGWINGDIHLPRGFNFDFYARGMLAHTYDNDMQSGINLLSEDAFSIGLHEIGDIRDFLMLSKAGVFFWRYDVLDGRIFEGVLKMHESELRKMLVEELNAKLPDLMLYAIPKIAFDELINDVQRMCGQEDVDFVKSMYRERPNSEGISVWFDYTIENIIKNMPEDKRIQEFAKPAQDRLHKILKATGWIKPLSEQAITVFLQKVNELKETVKDQSLGYDPYLSYARYGAHLTLPLGERNRLSLQGGVDGNSTGYIEYGLGISNKWQLSDHLELMGGGKVLHMLDAYYGGELQFSGPWDNPFWVYAKGYGAFIVNYPKLYARVRGELTSYGGYTLSLNSGYYITPFLNVWMRYDRNNFIPDYAGTINAGVSFSLQKKLRESGRSDLANTYHDARSYNSIAGKPLRESKRIHVDPFNSSLEDLKAQFGQSYEEFVNSVKIIAKEKGLSEALDIIAQVGAAFEYAHPRTDPDQLYSPETMYEGTSSGVCRDLANFYDNILHEINVSSMVVRLRGLNHSILMYQDPTRGGLLTILDGTRRLDTEYSNFSPQSIKLLAEQYAKQYSQHTLLGVNNEVTPNGKLLEIITMNVSKNETKMFQEHADFMQGHRAFLQEQYEALLKVLSEIDEELKAKRRLLKNLKSQGEVLPSTTALFLPEEHAYLQREAHFYAAA